MLCSNSNSGLLLRSVNQYIDYVSVRLKKLTHDLTYHRLELASVEDKECQLMSNVKLLRGETLKMRSEMERLGREIESESTFSTIKALLFRLGQMLASRGMFYFYICVDILLL